MDPSISFFLQVALAVLMLFFGIILNGIRTGMDLIRTDLKALNDAVLGKYVTLESVDRWRELHIRESLAKWDAHLAEHLRAGVDQRKLDHELRGLIQLIQVTLAKMQGKQYGDP